MPLDLEAIRKREQAATKGPWWVDVIPPPSFDDDPGWRTVLNGPGPKATGNPVVAAGRDAVLRVRDGTVHRGAIDIKADLEFAAHARTDLPAAIAELTTTRAILADALAEVKRLRAVIARVLNTETKRYFAYMDDNGDFHHQDPWLTKLQCQYAMADLRAALEGGLQPINDRAARLVFEWAFSRELGREPEDCREKPCPGPTGECSRPPGRCPLLTTEGECICPHRTDALEGKQP